MWFQEKAKDHLSSYKLNTLHIEKCGKWETNKKEYQHILPEDLKDYNILETYRNDFFKYLTDSKCIKLHKDFKHLNSSQAMCFNFFFPLIHENKLNIIGEIFGDASGISGSKFEHVISSKEGTNFDFYIELQSGRKIYFEIKYSETEFGRAVKDERHIKKYYEIYRDTLKGKIKNSKLNDINIVLDNYQLFRNSYYLEKNLNDKAIFLVPEKNSNLIEEFKVFKAEALADDYHDMVRIVTWEEILEKLDIHLKKANDESSLRLLKHYEEFKIKYIFS